MTVLEYQLRVLLQSQRQITALLKSSKALGGLSQAKAALEEYVLRSVRPTEVRIELPEDASIPAALPRDLLEALPIKWSRSSGHLVDRLQDLLLEADGESVVALSGDAIIDVRLLEDLVWGEPNRVHITGGIGERTAVMRIDAPLSSGDENAQSIEAIAEEALISGTVKGPIEPVNVANFKNWVLKLRRKLDPFLFRVSDEAARDRIEWFLFRSNYKGATDFLTAYVYPPIVWAILQPLLRYRVSPNWVTSVAIICTFAAIPFFAAGMWLPGLVLGYAMSVLDSVDGKLARLTFTSSAQGDTLDHGLDIIHPPLWYFAWAWGLSAGDFMSPLIQASGYLFILYIVDRILETLFRASTGQSIHGYEKIDVWMRTIISRRNINLAILTVALPFGRGVEAFYAIVAWQAFSAAFHLWRVVKFWNAGDSADHAFTQA
jgi:phosphatidylglycerophosphate synthase